jgi:hypothetical protein
LSTHCSNCEEGNIADWYVEKKSCILIRKIYFELIRYCDNCVDWLCLQCKNAHARVRLTKDHVVTRKTNGEARQIRGISQNEKFLCQVS